MKKQNKEKKYTVLFTLVKRYKTTVTALNKNKAGTQVQKGFVGEPQSLSGEIVIDNVVQIAP